MLFHFQNDLNPFLLIILCVCICDSMCVHVYVCVCSFVMCEHMYIHVMNAEHTCQGKCAGRHQRTALAMTPYLIP